MKKTARRSLHVYVILKRNSSDLWFFKFYFNIIVKTFFFTEKSITRHTYLDMIQQWLFPQVQRRFRQFSLSTGWGLTPLPNDVRDYLHNELPRRWVGCARKSDNCSVKWPSRCPDLSPCDICLWGHFNDFEYVPALPQNLEEHKFRIWRSFHHCNNMLERIWQEFDTK